MMMTLPNARFFKNNMLFILLAAMVIYALMSKKSSLSAVREGFEQAIEGVKATPALNGSAPARVLSKVKPNDEDDMEYGVVGDTQEINLPTCTQFVSSNLLPKDDPKLDASFTEFSPAKDLEGQSFIDTNKYAIGMQSQTLRNANHQLRSDPPISSTMACASPWNNTTIDQEERRPLSIGAA